MLSKRFVRSAVQVVFAIEYVGSNSVAAIHMSVSHPIDGAH